MKSTVPEIVAAHREAREPIEEAMLRLSDLVVDDGVAAVMTALPDDLRAAFATWAREGYDNDVPAEEFFIISNVPIDDRQRTRFHESIRLLRAWLAAQPRRD